MKVALIICFLMSTGKAFASNDDFIARELGVRLGGTRVYPIRGTCSSEKDPNGCYKIKKELHLHAECSHFSLGECGNIRIVEREYAVIDTDTKKFVGEKIKGIFQLTDRGETDLPTIMAELRERMYENAEVFVEKLVQGIYEKYRPQSWVDEAIDKDFELKMERVEGHLDDIMEPLRFMIDKKYRKYQYRERMKYHPYYSYGLFHDYGRLSRSLKVQKLRTIGYKW